MMYTIKIRYIGGFDSATRVGIVYQSFEPLLIYSCAILRYIINIIIFKLIDPLLVFAISHVQSYIGFGSWVVGIFSHFAFFSFMHIAEIISMDHNPFKIPFIQR